MRFLLNLSYLRKSILVVLFFACVRLVLSCFIELGNDESYYWTYSQHLQWNYFDHPPMVALWVRVFTLNLWLEDHVFFIRAAGIASCAVSSYFIYRTIAAISTEKAAFAGVFLYNCSFYAAITAGLIITPDTPQMVFWTLAMYQLTRICNDDQQWKPWLFFGISSGLCIMSKLHGVFLWAGLFVYALLYMRKWFCNPRFYLSGFITLMVTAPILLWNIDNHFITYNFHSRRVVVAGPFIVHWFGMLREFVGQLIINNPFNMVLAVFFLLYGKRTLTNAAPLRIYTLTGISLLFAIYWIAATRQSLPHWSGPAWICLIPVAAIGLSEVKRSLFRSTFKWMLAYTLIFIVLIIAAVNFYPGTFGSSIKTELGKGDISLDAFGWKEAGEKFGVIYRKENSNSASSNLPPLVCAHWHGAHYEYYFARPVKASMIGLGSIMDIHQYEWGNAFTLPAAKMDTAYCIVHSDEYYDPGKTFSSYYTTADSLATIEIFRNGKPAHDFYVYRLSGWKGGR